MGVGVGTGGSFFGSDKIYVIMSVWEGAGNAAVGHVVLVAQQGTLAASCGGTIKQA